MEIKKISNVITISDSFELHIVDFFISQKELYAELDIYLCTICVGKKKNDLTLIKKRLRNFLELKTQETKFGAIAELFIAFYLNKLGFKQEYLFFNLEEGSIKKGFDGVFSFNKESYIMESKSGQIESSGGTHLKKLQVAYLDLKGYVEGTSKKSTNNPWRNAYNHASHADVKTKPSLKKKLEALADSFDYEKFTTLTEFNLIPSSTIFTNVSNPVCPNAEVYSGLIELDTLILDNTIHYRGEHEYKTSIQNLYQ